MLLTILGIAAIFGAASEGIDRLRDIHVLQDMTLDEFRRVQRVNVEGVFLTFRAAARHMIVRGQGGSLVATASTAAAGISSPVRR